MFELEYYDGGAIDDGYSDLRSRNEPVVEITQVKGTSDTHPALSPNDEWAEFEIMPYRIGSVVLSLPREGSYVRDAYRRGLRIAEGGVMNPVQARPDRVERQPCRGRLLRGGRLLVQNGHSGRHARCCAVRCRARE